MAGESGIIPTSVLGTVGQITNLAAAGLQLFAMYKQAREAYKASHPDTPDGTFPEDSELIASLEGSASGLVAHADRLLTKYGAPATTVVNPAPQQ